MVKEVKPMDEESDEQKREFCAWCSKRLSEDGPDPRYCGHNCRRAFKEAD